MKIIVQLEMPDKQKKQPYASLKERVEYAIHGVEIGRNRQQCVQFLQDVYGKLELLEHPTEDQRICMERIHPVISNFGKRHRGGTEI